MKWVVEKNDECAEKNWIAHTFQKCNETKILKGEEFRFFSHEIFYNLSKHCKSKISFTVEFFKIPQTKI